MAIASVADLPGRAVAGRQSSAPASTRRPRTCTSSCSGSTASPRSCSRPRSRSARSSSPTAGSSSTPSPRSCTRPGSSSARSCSRAGSGSWRRPGARSPAPRPTSAIRAIGTRRTSFRIRPAFAVRTAAFREFIRLMVPRMFSVADRAADRHLLHRSSRPGSASARVASLNFGLDYQVLPVSLIGVSFSLAVFPVLSAAFADGDGAGVPGGPRPQPRDHRAS